MESVACARNRIQLIILGLIKQLAYIFVTIDIVLLLIINIPRGLRIFRWLSCATLQPNRSPLYQVTKEISDE